MQSSDLAKCLKDIWDDLRKELRSEPQPDFRVVAEGKPRDLDPLIQDEICRIAREALRNTLRHANAGRLEAELAYGNEEFSLRIRDDGVGIDDQVLQHGARSGHWGLQGMRERAQGVGGQLQVWSRTGAGTEVQIAVPARAAYGKNVARSKVTTSVDRL
jgi:signal transduction histidine kinase